MRQDSLGRIVQPPFEERLRAQLEKCLLPEGGCWLWQGAKAGAGGYPVIRSSEGKQTRVSRIMLELSGRARPSESHVACHTCDTPACVNPQHLFWGTNRENTQDAGRKGRLKAPTGAHLEKLKELTRQRWEDPEFRERHRQAMVKLAQEPDFGERVSKGLKNHFMSLE